MFPVLLSYKIARETKKPREDRFCWLFKALAFV